ncbi:Hypothetical protein FKW44_015067 [Caligus rogercresseyi]|uniref:Uncharacterized protein n=1 Tax=Caligus rogercresseyi TaxID=217165 RepID=A0A7T8GZR5_CALRO|nr:Hypothetical protein FKW44_015067 [Caligus rogercresseyi]
MESRSFLEGACTRACNPFDTLSQHEHNDSKLPKMFEEVHPIHKGSGKEPLVASSNRAVSVLPAV